MEVDEMFERAARRMLDGGVGVERGRILHSVGDDKIQSGLAKDLLSLLDIGPFQPNHNRHLNPRRLCGFVPLQRPSLLQRHRRILGLCETGLSRPRRRPRGARRADRGG